jgi:hypothetical protein
MTTETITVQLPSELIQKARNIAGKPEALQDFLVHAIEHEIERCQENPVQQGFSAALQKFRQEIIKEGIDINPDEIWGDVRDRSPGREVIL